MVPFVTKRTGSTNARRLTIAFVSLCGALFCAEIFVRITPQSSVGFVLDATITQYEPSLFQRHPVQINVLAPNASARLDTIEYSTSIRINSIGLRGPELQSSQETIAVLTVGDSFTLGLQVEEEQTWQASLSRSLTQAMRRPVELLNAGVDGYGTRQATAQLRRLANQTGARHAVLAFYLGNDFRDNAILEQRRSLMRSRPSVGTQDESASRGSPSMARLSRLYATWLAASQVRRNATDFRIAEYADEMMPFVSEQALAQLLPYTQEALAEFESTCSELNISCIIALIPPAWMVNNARAESTLELFGLEQNQGGYGAPATAVAEATTLPVIDLTEQLFADKGNYLTFDPHWSAAGHAVAANALQPALLQLISTP